jgi:putative copper export protein
MSWPEDLHPYVHPPNPPEDNRRLRRGELLWPEDPGYPDHSGQHDLRRTGRRQTGPHDLLSAEEILRRSGEHDLRAPAPAPAPAWAEGLNDPTIVEAPAPKVGALPWVDQVMGDAAAASRHRRVDHHGSQAFGLREPARSDGLQTEFATVHSGWAKFGWFLRDLGVVIGLVLMVVGAWAVLVHLRLADTQPTGEGLAADLDVGVTSTMRADRVAAVGTWVGTVTTMLVLGAVIFSSFVATSASRAVDRSTVRLVRLAAVVGAAASLATVPFRAAALTGAGRAAMTDFETLRFVATSRFGSAALLRVAGLLLACFAVPGPGSRTGRGRARPDRPDRLERPVDGSVVDHLLGGAGAALILGSYAWVGHPQATEGPALEPLLVAAQSIHIVAVATWFGGLVLLYLQIRAGRRAGMVRTSAEVVERFSTAAGLSVALVAASGLALARSQISDISALTSTPYGRALAIKLGLVALVVVIGGINKVFVVPRIKRQEGPKAWRSLHRTLLCEAAVIAGGVLLATSAMVSGGI